MSKKHKRADRRDEASLPLAASEAPVTPSAAKPIGAFVRHSYDANGELINNAD